MNMPAQPHDDWQRLKDYGYAPGNYMSRCHRCKSVAHDVDKYATTCRRCAEAMHAEANVQPKGTEPAAYISASGEPHLTEVGRGLPWGTPLYTAAPSPAPGAVPSDEHLMNFLAPWVIADDPRDRADFLTALRAAFSAAPVSASGSHP